MDINTSKQYNQITSRMVAGSFNSLKDKQYVTLRYVPRELKIINISTLGNSVENSKDKKETK